MAHRVYNSLITSVCLRHVAVTAQVATHYLREMTAIVTAIMEMMNLLKYKRMNIIV